MNFKEFLYKNKLKQVDIAKYLNITEASVSRFAKGIANPSKENLCKLLDNPYINHLTWLGGEPTMWASAIADINRQIKDKFPNKKIWLYSGHTLEELLNNLTTRDLLYTIDVLVDGPFINDKKNIDLKFRGSSNQRIIDNINGLFFIRK